MSRFFKEKVLSPGAAVIIILCAMLGTYLVTSLTASSDIPPVDLPTLPPINTERPAEFTDDELCLYACIDAFDTHSDEILPLRTLSGTVRMVAFDAGDGLTLCYLLEELSSAKPDSAARLSALLGFAPSYKPETAVIFEISASDVFRPAYSTDCTSASMTVEQCELTDSQRDFINGLIIQASDKQFAFTRLGYSYDWQGASPYGLSQFAADISAGNITAKTSVSEFLASL